MSQEQEKALRELMQLTAQLMAKHTSIQKIEKVLMDRGASRAVASEIIRVVNEARKEAMNKQRLIKQKQGAEDIKRGFLILAVGLVITGITYLIASGSGGGAYILTWGAILVGALYIIQGVLKSL